MPYALCLCPMPYIKRAPHFTEKGYRNIQYSSYLSKVQGIEPLKTGIRFDVLSPTCFPNSLFPVKINAFQPLKRCLKISPNIL